MSAAVNALVLDIIVRADAPLSAPQVCDRLPERSVAETYKALKALTEGGAIERLGARNHYRYAVAVDPAERRARVVSAVRMMLDELPESERLVVLCDLVVESMTPEARAALLLSARVGSAATA